MNTSLFINYLKIYLTPFFVSFLLIATLTGCFEHVQTYNRHPVAPPISSTIASTTTQITSLSINYCRVTQVKIPAIPNATITVNEADTSIYVQYPTDVGGKPFKVEYQLNLPECSIWKGDANLEYSTCGGTWTSVNVILRLSNTDYHSRTYKIKYRPTGPLSIGQGSEPLSLTIGETDQTPIQVVHYFTRAGYPKEPKVLLTRISDGREKSGTLTCNTPPGRTEISVNQLLLSTSTRPEDEGTYRLQLLMPDGTIIVSSQPVVIQLTRKLMITDAGYFQDYLPEQGKNYWLYGYNLSADYKAGADLISNDGKRTALPVVDYRNGGLAMIVQIPNTLKGGHYLLQATQNGIPVSNPYHYVVNDGNRPVFVHGFKPYTTYPVSPADIQLGQTFWIRFYPVFVNGEYSKTKLKLVSKTNPLLVYLTDIKVVEERPYAGFYPPTVQLPTDWLPGEYSASLLQMQPDGSLLEGQPHPQTIRLTR